MAKQNKSDLVGNLINKRKFAESLEESSKGVVEDLSKKDTGSTSEEKKPRRKAKKSPETASGTDKGELGKVDSILGELKGKDKKQDKYSSIKIKTEVYNRIKRIARKEGIDRHGHLITKVLTDFCDRYDKK